MIFYQSATVRMKWNYRERQEKWESQKKAGEAAESYAKFGDGSSDMAKKISTYHSFWTDTGIISNDLGMTIRHIVFQYPRLAAAPETP